MKKMILNYILIILLFKIIKMVLESDKILLAYENAIEKEENELKHIYNTVEIDEWKIDALFNNNRYDREKYRSVLKLIDSYNTFNGCDYLEYTLDDKEYKFKCNLQLHNCKNEKLLYTYDKVNVIDTFNCCYCEKSIESTYLLFELEYVELKKFYYLKICIDCITFSSLLSLVFDKYNDSQKYCECNCYIEKDIFNDIKIPPFILNFNYFKKWEVDYINFITKTEKGIIYLEKLEHMNNRYKYKTEKTEQNIYVTNILKLSITNKPNDEEKETLYCQICKKNKTINNGYILIDKEKKENFGQKISHFWGEMCMKCFYKYDANYLFEKIKYRVINNDVKRLI
jgi:hypothetical protein